MGPTMTDVAIAIPAVSERMRLVYELIEALGRECRGSIPGVRIHDPADAPAVDFPLVMENAAAFGRRWVLQCEDDIQLAPGFGRSMLAALAHAEASGVACVTFFSRSKKDLEMLDRGETFRRLAPAAFSMSQCFAVRSESVAGISGWAPEWYAAHPEHNRAADLLWGAWLSRQRARVLVHVPSLVQHRPGPSTLPGHHGARQSESYRRVFGDH